MLACGLASRPEHRGWRHSPASILWQTDWHSSCWFFFSRSQKTFRVRLWPQAAAAVDTYFTDKSNCYSFNRRLLAHSLQFANQNEEKIKIWQRFPAWRLQMTQMPTWCGRAAIPKSACQEPRSSWLRNKWMRWFDRRNRKLDSCATSSQILRIQSSWQTQIENWGFILRRDNSGFCCCCCFCSGRGPCASAVASFLAGLGELAPACGVVSDSITLDQLGRRPAVFIES